MVTIPVGYANQPEPPGGLSRRGRGGLGQPGGGADDGQSAGGVEATRAARADAEDGAGRSVAAGRAIDGGGGGVGGARATDLRRAGPSRTGDERAGRRIA